MDQFQRISPRIFGRLPRNAREQDSRNGDGRPGNARKSARRRSARDRAAGLAGITAVLVAGVAACGPEPGRPVGERSPGRWEITVYYTAVESYHAGSPLAVRGCPRRDCAFGDDLLGTFPEDFAQAVRDEGTGRITSGPRRGSFLNWSHDTGFWLDDIPADSAGRALVPFRTAAADAGTLPPGTAFLVEDCGREEDGSGIDPDACAALRRGRWEVRDEFTPGLGGPGHVDLYIGEEDRPDFSGTSPRYLTGVGARLTVTGRGTG
ncbi:MULTISPECIES: hypothetical protein [unclassified Frankia]|uniref:hypothetical protein n=1 Tax=unclassified Frankia TaxID=2632575 RepID=UPI0020253C19